MGELFASVRQEGCCQESIGRNMHGSSHVCPAQRKMAAKLRKLLSKLIRFQNRGVREYPIGQRTTRGWIIGVTRRYVGVHVRHGVAKVR
jgi:hypothetical protein